MKFEYDSIMIIVNKFTKRTYFISFHKKISTEKIVYLFEWYIIANHEVLTKIIFDKNTWFRLKFWQIFIILKEIKTKMSTIKYLQTNKQIEQFN